MAAPASFERSVFINCPFDDEFAPLLQAVAFVVADLGFLPRLAPENADSGEARLDRIIDLIRQSRFGIHDLSRRRAMLPGEYYRLNMPFELGLDHGAARFGFGRLATKSILVLEETRYDFHRSISDISGWDIETHGGEHTEAVRKVSRWLIRHAGAEPVGPARILGRYQDFQEWYWERELGRGASEDDIRSYPTVDFVQAMVEWVELGRPV
jgi:hypothetical protein